MAACGIHGKDRQRCGGMGRHASPWRVRGRRCRNWPVPGRTRCRLHGGLSTGPKTPEGMARSVAAKQAGRMRRIAELALEGKKIRTGRPTKQGPLAKERKAPAAEAFKHRRVRPRLAEVLTRLEEEMQQDSERGVRAAMSVLRLWGRKQRRRLIG